MAARISASWRPRAARIASGWCSQRAVLPSMSVNRKVTVPLGRLAMGTPQHRYDAASVHPSGHAGCRWPRRSGATADLAKASAHQRAVRGADPVEPAALKLDAVHQQLAAAQELDVRGAAASTHE